MVYPEGLEPSPLARPAPQTGASAVPPRVHEWTRSDSNRQPSPCKGAALPLELQARVPVMTLTGKRSSEVGDSGEMGWGGESNPSEQGHSLKSGPPVPQRCQTRVRTWNLRLNRPLHYRIVLSGKGSGRGIRTPTTRTKTLRAAVTPIPNGGERLGRLEVRTESDPFLLFHVGHETLPFVPPQGLEPCPGD